MGHQDQRLTTCVHHPASSQEKEIGTVIRNQRQRKYQWQREHFRSLPLGPYGRQHHGRHRRCVAAPHGRCIHTCTRETKGAQQVHDYHKYDAHADRRTPVHLNIPQCACSDALTSTVHPAQRNELQIAVRSAFSHQCRQRSNLQLEFYVQGTQLQPTSRAMFTTCNMPAVAHWAVAASLQCHAGLEPRCNRSIVAHWHATWPHSSLHTQVIIACFLLSG